MVYIIKPFQFKLQHSLLLGPPKRFKLITVAAFSKYVCRKEEGWHPGPHLL